MPGLALGQHAHGNPTFCWSPEQEPNSEIRTHSAARGSGEGRRSATIVTLEPNELFAPIHNRMAMILPASDYDAWLSPDTDPDQALQLVHEWDPSEFEAYEVSTYVNNARNEGPTCLEPLSPAPES